MVDRLIEDGRRIPALRQVSDIPEGGLIQTWFDLGTGLLENSVRVSHSVAQTLRSEISRRSIATLEWVEGFPQGMFHIAKTVAEALDAVTGDVIARSERAALATLRAADKATGEVRDLAGRTVQSVVGNGASPRNHVSHAS